MSKRKSSSDQQFTSYPPNAFKRDKLNEHHSSAKSFELKPLQKSQSSQLITIRNSHQDQHYNKYKTHDINHHHNNDSVLQENQMESDQSENQQIEKQAQDIVNELRKRQQVNKANNKMVVGGGFSFDITEFFKFEKKKKLDSRDGDIFQQITGSVLAWIILLYSVVNSAMIPSWIMNIKATKLLRISWRFLMQSLMIFPFVLYERRVGNEEVKYQYTFSHIIKPVHLKKVYISSIATSIWFTCVLTVFEWTYVSHGLVLGSLSNFFLSIHRSLTKSEHDLQPGGRYCVILGILLVIYDSYALQPQKVEPFIRDVVNPFYLDRAWYQRVLADLAALVVSFTISKLSRYTSDMKSHYPPYLSMLLVNFFVAINMIFSAYFFNGLTFDTDSRFGFFSLFSQEHFAGFLYMSIVLCFGMFVSFVLISKLFQDPILPALAMTLDPIIGTLLLQLAGIQYMPKAYSFIGYLFIVPGSLLILIGQCLYQRSMNKNNEQEQKKKTIQIIKQLKQLKQVKSTQERKRRLERVKSIKQDIDIERKEFSHNVGRGSHGNGRGNGNGHRKGEINTTVSLNLPLLGERERERESDYQNVSNTIEEENNNSNDEHSSK